MQLMKCNKKTSILVAVEIKLSLGPKDQSKILIWKYIQYLQLQAFLVKPREVERNIEKCFSQNITLEMFLSLRAFRAPLLSLSLEPDSLYMPPFLHRECLVNGPPARHESSGRKCARVWSSSGTWVQGGPRSRRSRPLVWGWVWGTVRRQLALKTSQLHGLQRSGDAKCDTNQRHSEAMQEFENQGDEFMFNAMASA